MVTVMVMISVTSNMNCFNNNSGKAMTLILIKIISAGLGYIILKLLLLIHQLE